MKVPLPSRTTLPEPLAVYFPSPEVGQPKKERDMNSSYDGVMKDVAFNRHSMNKDGKHTSPSKLHDDSIHIGVSGLEVKLIQGINEDDFKNVMSIATRATTGVDPDLPDERLWDEMLKGGLQTALETQTVIFLVTGCSRALTHQLVRTRKASFHQQSQRATFMGREFNVRIPRSIVDHDNEDILHAYVSSIRLARHAYNMACDGDISYQDARYILPEGSETQILCEYPLREFLNVYAYRACTMFLHEHVVAMREMGRLLVEAHPWLEPHVKISCEKSKVCEFQGWEAVDEQCDFPWAREDNRRYRPARELQIKK